MKFRLEFNVEHESDVCKVGQFKNDVRINLKFIEEITMRVNSFWAFNKRNMHDITYKQPLRVSVKGRWLKKSFAFMFSKKNLMNLHSSTINDRCWFFLLVNCVLKKLSLSGGGLWFLRTISIQAVTFRKYFSDTRS